MKEYDLGFKNLNIADIGLKLNIILNERYEIREYVSLGSMTIMYLAKDSQTGKIVLVKELAPVDMVNRDLDGMKIVTRNEVCKKALQRLQENFDNEIRIVKSLSLPSNDLKGCIPEYVDDFYENDTRYMVMNFFEGKSLQKRVEHHEEISFKKTASELISIVQKIHKAGIIHRDIKYSNILVKDNGEIVLLDFGSACFIEKESDSFRCVSSGVSAPEMYSKDITTRWCDIFSIGAVMYQMLTGKKPIQIKNKQIYIDDISDYVNIPWVLSMLIMKMLEIRPEKRLKNLWLVKLLL